MAEEPPAKRAKLANGASRPPKRFKGRAAKPPKPGSSDATIIFALQDLLGADAIEAETTAGRDRDPPYDRFSEIEVEVKALSSHGDGLALADDGRLWVVVVPFCLPGERVLARIHRHDRLHSHADLMRVLRAADETHALRRDDARIRCPYFGSCSGCQVRP